MTAISMMYTAGKRFVIAADGRCKSDAESASKEGETEEAQKIFPFETDNIKMAWAMAGMSSTEDGRFDLVAESKKQMEALVISRLSNGHQYVKGFCARLKRAIVKARLDGRITKFPKTEHLEPEEKGRIVRVFFLGYFRGLPFWAEAKFYHHKETDSIERRINDSDFSQPLMAIGPDVIADMMYRSGATVDPRLATYKRDIRDGDLEYVSSYIRACSDPAAVEIDSCCKYIGGHIHAAEITPDGFRWLIEPKHDPKRHQIKA